mgnify:CR=1 FL=1
MFFYRRQHKLLELSPLKLNGKGYGLLAFVEKWVKNLGMTLGEARKEHYFDRLSREEEHVHLVHIREREIEFARYHFFNEYLQL